jgi:hypothetical protein
MKLKLSTGLAAGLLALAASPALAAPNVTVRVEGANGTLLERTAVTLGSAQVLGCDGDSAIAALDAATHGNWDRQQFASTILGETHSFANSDYWAEWVDHGAGYVFGGGLCTDKLAEGDELLMLVDYSPPPTYAPTVFPIDLEGVPATATAGADVTVTAVEHRTTGTVGEGVRTPLAGATVTGGAAPVTTDAAGHATVRLAAPGAAVLKATKAGDAPSAGEVVAVAALVAGAPAPTPAPAGAVRDTTPPTAKLSGLSDHQALTTGPRELRGSFGADASGIATVKLRLTKRAGNRCWYFSGRSEKFRGTRCGHGPYFAIGAAADWSYLLPAKLGSGRYVLDAVAIDRAGNRTPLARGTTRVVFTVR